MLISHLINNLKSELNKIFNNRYIVCNTSSNTVIHMEIMKGISSRVIKIEQSNKFWQKRKRKHIADRYYGLHY